MSTIRDGVEPHPADQPATSLAAAVARAIHTLGNLHRLHPDVGSGVLSHELRSHLDHIQRSGAARRADDAESAAVAAVRTACAHLAVTAYEDAYLALVTARDLLRRPNAGPAGSGAGPA